MKALKVKWIPHVVNGNNFLSVLFNDVVGEQMNSMVWYLDKHSVKMLSKHIRHEFWRDVVKAWEDLLEEPTDVNVILSIPLWNSSFVTNENIKKLQKDFVQSRCICINDLVTEDGNFLSYQEFQNVYHVPRLNILDYFGLLRSIPNKWRNIISNSKRKLIDGKENELLDIITKTTTVCKCVYTKFITLLQYKNKALDKWNTVLQQTLSEDDWIAHNTIVYQVTKNTKLQSFQFKIMQRILCTNRVLKMCKIKTEDRCSFCKVQPETITHLLWECPLVQSLWQELTEWLSPNIKLTNYLNVKDILLGKPNQYEKLPNILILRTKYYVYCRKCCDQKLCLSGLKEGLKNEYKLEKCIAMRNGSMEQFNETWKNFMNFIL